MIKQMIDETMVVDAGCVHTVRPPMAMQWGGGGTNGARECGKALAQPTHMFHISLTFATPHTPRRTPPPLARSRPPAPARCSI
jgi:hypothetical protein